MGWDKMINSAEIDIKLRNKQHQLEQRAHLISKELKDVGVGLLSTPVASAQTHLSNDLQQELQQVQHAILRIKQGHYSHCELCQKEIEAQRLLLLPYTALCARCAEE